MLTDSNDRRVSLDRLVACPGCDLLHYRQTLNANELARCERCQHVLQTCKLHTVDRTLGAVIAGILLLLVSLFLPFLSLSRSGLESSISVLDAITALWVNNMEGLGLLTLAFIVLLPLVRLVLLAWVLWCLRTSRAVTSAMRMAFRWSLMLEPWAMAEIFMVGVVVSLVKISALASLQIGTAFWALLALIGLFVLINLLLCKDTVWNLLSQAQ